MQCLRLKHGPSPSNTAVLPVSTPPRLPDNGRPRRWFNAPDFRKASLGDVGLELRKAHVSDISGVRKAEKAKSPKLRS